MESTTDIPGDLMTVGGAGSGGVGNWLSTTKQGSALHQQQAAAPQDGSKGNHCQCGIGLFLKGARRQLPALPAACRSTPSR